LDTRVTDPDQFLNVRDEKVKRDNHNILLAKRCKHMLFSLAMGTDSSDYLIAYSGRPVIQEAGMKFGSVLLTAQPMLSPYVNEVTVDIRAALENGSYGDAKIYGQITGRATVITTGGTSITSASDANYSMTIPVPAGANFPDREMATLQLLFETPANTTATKGNITIVGAGSNWIEYTGGSSIVNHIIMIERNGTGAIFYNDPRRVVREELLYDGSHDRAWVDRPWSQVPDTGDQVFFYPLQGLKVDTVTAYEEVRTDLHSNDYSDEDYIG